MPLITFAVSPMTSGLAKCYGALKAKFQEQKAKICLCLR